MPTDLVDTTEMYLRTVLELEEEEVPALRARIAERLKQSGPTVSQTVARMERDGLLNVEGDRHLVLTDLGRIRAVAVMRKHRLAELLLVNVIGMPYEEAHDEACRWEHVMSEAVEQKVYELLGRPSRSPYGNPIPGLEEFGPVGDEDVAGPGERNLAFPGLTGRSPSVASARACRPTRPCCAACTQRASTRVPTSWWRRSGTRWWWSATATPCACPARSRRASSSPPAEAGPPKPGWPALGGRARWC